MDRGFLGGGEGNQEFKMLSWKCLLYSDSIQKEKFPQAAVVPWKQASKRRLFKFSVGYSQNKNLETEQNGALESERGHPSRWGDGMGVGSNSFWPLLHAIVPVIKTPMSSFDLGF